VEEKVMTVFSFAFFVVTQFWKCAITLSAKVQEKVMNAYISIFVVAHVWKCATTRQEK
jgi:hypothetical protein